MTGADHELCYLSACEALRRFREKTLSSVEVLEAQIARAGEVEERINAFSRDRFETALTAALQAEQAYAGPASGIGPLTGITTGLKNEQTLAGCQTTEGSLLNRDVVDTTTHPVAQRLLDAGAIIHARTNVPEFSSAVFTSSKLHGITRNPWNPDYSPGGSSGGSAAALAAGTATLATGSDIAGSIRIPASLCNVVGFKPSYGRVPEADPFYSQDSYNHNGPMARTVEDCALMFAVIHGPHPADLASIRPRLQVPTTFKPVTGMKIALSHDLGFFHVDNEVVNNTDTVARALESRGASVEQVDVPWSAAVGDAAVAHLGFLMGRDMARYLDHGREQMHAYSIELAETGLATTTEQFHAAIRTTGNMYRELGLILEQYDALICPAIASTGWPAQGRPECLKLILEECMTWPFNMLSRCPVLSVPSGFAANGVPTGVQVVGRTYDDLTTLQIGAALQAELQWHTQYPQC